jgi:hypothetical protein
MNAKEFVVDYVKRHAHPVNAMLHLVGVPAVFVGIYYLVVGRPLFAAGLVVIGYFLQYLGHRAQGNEVGEVTLIKYIVRVVSRKVGGSA